MPNKTGIIKYRTVKDYITKATKMRSQKSAVTKLIADFDAILQAVAMTAGNLAAEDDRSTIMKQDMDVAINRHLKKEDLPWDQTLREVIKHSPTELGKISKDIRKWIREHEGA